MSPLTRAEATELKQLASDTVTDTWWHGCSEVGAVDHDELLVELNAYIDSITTDE